VQKNFTGCEFGSYGVHCIVQDWSCVEKVLSFWRTNVQSKMASKYDDRFEVQSEGKYGEENAGSKFDEGNSRRRAPPPARKPPPSGKGRVLPPPSGTRPGHLSAVSRARLKYAKPPSNKPAPAGAAARAEYRRIAMQKKQAQEAAKKKDDEENQRSHNYEQPAPTYSSKVADDEEEEGYGDNIIESRSFPADLPPSEDDEENDSYEVDEIDDDAWRMTSSKSGGRNKSASSRQRSPKSNEFFSDDDGDSDGFYIPDLNEVDHDDLKEEFGLDSWADKNKRGRGGDRGKRTPQKQRSQNNSNGRARGKVLSSKKVLKQQPEGYFEDDDDVEEFGAPRNSATDDGTVAYDLSPQHRERQMEISVGDTVEAKARGWLRFYGGVVSNVDHRAGTYEVSFHDGEVKGGIPPSDIVLINQANEKKNGPAPRRTNSSLTERSSPKLNETNLNGVETLISDDARKRRPDAMRGLTTGHDPEGKVQGPAQVESPKGSSTEPRGTKRDKMTSYNVGLVPTRRSDLFKFLVLPPYKGVNKNIRCYIIRHRSGANRFNPLYTFHVEQNGKKNSRQLMVAQKLMGCTSTNFLISLDREDMGKSYNSRSKWYMGKLQAKKGTDEFVLYDRGMNPTDLVDLVKSTKWEMKESAARREMATVVYNRKKDVAKSRRMEVSLPAVVRDDGKTVTEAQFRPFTDEDSMYKLFSEVREEGKQNVKATERILCLQNRMFSAGKTSILSDFKGRANETSVKNFQLCVSYPSSSENHTKFMETKLGKAERLDPERVLLQLGRDSERFNVDFTYPMSFFAAFGICLTRFATKAVEDF
jgi:hypothetical protein